MYQRILVPVDGSPTSTRGLDEAIRLAKDQDATIRVVHVVEEYILIQSGGMFGGDGNAGDLIDMLRKEGEKTVAEAVALAGKQGVKAESAVLEKFSNRSSEGILEEARNWKADLIVMGTHGRRGMSHLMLGSDAEIVVRTAQVPVLLVRSQD